MCADSLLFFSMAWLQKKYAEMNSTLSLKRNVSAETSENRFNQFPEITFQSSDKFIASQMEKPENEVEGSSR